MQISTTEKLAVLFCDVVESGERDTALIEPMLKVGRVLDSELARGGEQAGSFATLKKQN